MTDRAGNVDRRTVLRGAVLTAGGAVLVACGGDGSATGAGEASASPAPAGAGPSAGPSAGASAAASGAPGGAALAALADVAVGTAVSATSSAGPVLLVRTSETEVVGFSAVCPHQGCTVAPSQEGLACPCHMSTFELTTGAVVQGPATRDLSPYPVTVVDGSIVPA